jgi:hypothetical protein
MALPECPMNTPIIQNDNGFSNAFLEGLGLAGGEWPVRSMIQV